MNPENEPIPDAPIVEAVVDIDCELAPGMDITSLRDAAGDALRERYPKFRKQLIQEHQFSQKADAPPELKMRQGVGAMQFLSDDERQLVQFRPNGFSFNRLTPYRSLDDYFPEIEAGWNLYLKLAKPVRVRKLGMRMINRILLPMVDGQVQLSEFLTVYPKLPETGSTLNFAGFLDQHKAIDVKSGNQVTIIKTIEVTQGNKLPLILDIEAFYPCKEYPQDWEVLRERLNSLRILKNQIFRNSITQQCQNHFSQQAIVAGCYTASIASSRYGTAVSNEAEEVRKNQATVVEQSRKSVALYGRKNTAVSELLALADECADADWDGYGAEPVNASSLELARELIETLPNGLPLPQVSIEPDGCVSFDWMPAPYRTLTLSVEAGGRLPYAWVDGTDRGHAVASLEQDELPERIIQEIKRFTPDAAVVRIA